MSKYGFTERLFALLFAGFMLTTSASAKAEPNNEKLAAHAHVKAYCLSAQQIIDTHTIARMGYVQLSFQLAFIQLQRGECYIPTEPVKFEFLKRGRRVIEDQYLKSGYIIAGRVTHDGQPIVVYKFFSDKDLEKLLGQKI